MLINANQLFQLLKVNSMNFSMDFTHCAFQIREMECIAFKRTSYFQQWNNNIEFIDKTDGFSCLEKLKAFLAAQNTEIIFCSENQDSAKLRATL